MAQKRPQTENRYQLAVDVLQKGREVLLRDLTEEILYHAEDFEEGGFLFQEFLENQGTKLHFLYLMLSQLEQSAEAFEATSRRTRAAAKNAARSAKAAARQPVPSTDDATGETEEYSAPATSTARSGSSARRPRKVRAQSSVPSASDDGE